jgi:hypothetical protein
MGENHIMLFLYIKRIHSLEAPTSDSPATTGRRLQPPILRLQPEGSYNSLNSLAPTRRRLQPPEFSGSNRKVATTTYPCPILSALKYKCRPTVTITNSATATTTTTTMCLFHCLCHSVLSLSLSLSLPLCLYHCLCHSVSFTVTVSSTCIFSSIN